MRLARDWTLEAVAERSGVEPRNLFDVEHAKVNTSAWLLFRLLEAFDVSADQLLVRAPSKQAAAGKALAQEEPRAAIVVARELEATGRRIAFYRKAARLTVDELAARAEMGTSTLYALESSERAVALELYLRAGAALGLSMKELFVLDPKEAVASQAPLPAPVGAKARKRTTKGRRGLAGA